MSVEDSKLEKIESDDSTNVVDVHGSVKREKGEPRVGMEPVSLWVFFGAAVILMLAAGYTGGLYGGFRMDNVYAVHGYTPDPRPLGPGEEAGAQQMTPQLWIEKGKQAYNNCVACHNAAGTGAPGLFPPLVGSEWVSGSTERIAVLILKGLAGPMTVKGVPYNNVMPAWEQAVNDKQLAQVISYIRNSWGNSGSIVTEEMAAHAREKYSGQPGPWSAQKLLEIPDGEAGNLPGTPVVMDDPETWVHLEKP